MDWNEGYVTDIDYTYDHYRELEPLRAQFVMAYAGVLTKKLDTACELGFGQGISLNINAAGTEIAWFGTDFNPSQVSNAKHLSSHYDADPFICDDDFASFAKRDNLPKFDFISLHGIWSWISDQNRNTIAEFIRTKLNVGGIVYLSYNTLPGWNQMVPIRNLMMDVMDATTSPKDLSNTRVVDTLEEMDKFSKLNPRYLLTNPQGKNKLEQLSDLNKNYVAHEYFNRDWKAMNFSDVSQTVRNSKIQYVASANLLENLSVLNFTPDQDEYLRSVKNIGLKETLRDYILNQTFRKDYWVKGGVDLSATERLEALDEFHVIAARSLKTFDYKLKCNIGEANLTEEIYKPIIDLMSDYKPLSIKEVRSKLSNDGLLNTQKVLEAIYILVGNNTLLLAYDFEHGKRNAKHTKNLNNALIKKSVDATYVNYLVSPLTGSGIPVGRIEQIFLHLHMQKVENENELALGVQKILEQRGQTLTLEGAAIPHGAELKAALLVQAKKFKSELIPLYKSLMLT